MHSLYMWVCPDMRAAPHGGPHGRLLALLATRREARRDAHGPHRVASHRAVHCMPCTRHAAAARAAFPEAWPQCRAWPQRAYPVSAR